MNLIRTSLAALLIACSPAAQPAPVDAPPVQTATEPAIAPEPEPEPEPPVEAPASKLVIVSFISIGQGTDVDAFTQLDEILEGYELTRETRHWGKEGEQDECLDTAALTKRERRQLLQELASAFAHNRLVQIEERDRCEPQ